MYFTKFLFEPSALENDYGKSIYDSLKEKGLQPLIKTGRIRAKDEYENDLSRYREGKRTLIIGTRSVKNFERCRPSADYQLPVLTGCPGLCEYCYLMTRMGERPYVKLNSDIVNVFTTVRKYTQESMPKTVSFELSASSDPIPFEESTGIVSKMINYFSETPNAQLRICTKYDPSLSILKARHNSGTDIRFSVNTPKIISEYEHATPILKKRLAAAESTVDAGYKTGIMIAPVFLYEGWRNDYSEMLDLIYNKLGASVSTFEVVTHRFTAKAKETITKIFPQSTLDMDEQSRRFKMGQFGYGKYVYGKEQLESTKEFFSDEIAKRFPDAKLLYVV